MPKTQVKDQATAEFAARNLDSGVELPGKQVEPNAPKVQSTSEKLFPEFTTDDGAIVNRPVRPFEDKTNPLPASATTTPATQPQTPAPAAPTAPAYLKTDELAGKMVKIKVDGVESDVPAESLVKNFQLERHLNAQLQNLADERRRLEQERIALTQKPATQEQPRAKSEGKKSAEVEALEANLAQTQAQLAALAQAVQPQIQKSGIERLDQRVKETFGADDFMSYFPKIRETALAEAGRPEVAANPQAVAFYDSSEYYFQKYQEMKLKDTISKPAQAITPQIQNTPVLVTQSGAPVVVNSQGQPVSMPVFEGSGGVPSKSGSSGDWAQQAQALFDRARQTGDQQDWVAYYRAKSQGS